MADSQLRAFSKRRDATIGDLNPHVEVLLDMPDEEESPEEEPETGSDSKSGPSMPGDLAQGIADRVLPPERHTVEKEPDIFDSLKDFDPKRAAAQSPVRPVVRNNPFMDVLPEASKPPKNEELDDLMGKMGITDEPPGNEVPAAEAPVTRTLRATVPRGGKGAEKITSKPLGEDSPEADMLRLLADCGVTRGKVYITTQFFRKGDNDPKWLNDVMAEAGQPPNKRRMAVIGWFGDTPERLGVDINRVGSKGGGIGVEDALKELEQQDAEELKRLTLQQRMDDARERMGLPARSKKRGGADDDDELIEIPVQNADGTFAKDIKGVPVVVKVTKKQYFWMKQEERNLAQTNKNNNGDGNSNNMMMIKMMEAMHEKEIASNERFGKMMEEMRTNREASERSLLGYVLSKEREEKKQLMAGMRSDTDILDNLDGKLNVYERLGLITREKTTPLDQQTKLIQESRSTLKEGYTTAQSDLKSLAEWIREDMKEERRLRHPELVNDSKVDDKTKNDFYSSALGAAASPPRPPPPPDLLGEIKPAPLPPTPDKEKKVVAPESGQSN